MDSDLGTAPKMNGGLPPQQGTVYIRVSLPESNTQECLQFQLYEAVGVAKQQVIERLGRNLKDPLNYGLYCPSINGKAGKFLQEERPLRDYPLPGPIGFLEFKYKRRVYRGLNVGQTKLKKLHTKGNLRQFLEYVKMGDVAKVTKWTTKGIDPNFYCRQTGETPLTMAVRVSKPRELIMSLVSGGAHLDFRSRDSATPLHKAAMIGNCEAITTLLDLGQSPNCRDLKGLTPLFYVVANDTSSTCSDRLLYEHSIIGVADETGAQEVHHACRAGRVQHLQNLISYGADMNVQDKRGNTPLHVCALGPQDSCARLLLFRGADRTVTNDSGQTPYQLAVLTGHQDIAELIKTYSDSEVVPIKGNPNFNRKRRTSIPSLRFNSLRTASMHNLNQQFDDDQGIGPVSGGGTLPSRDARVHARTGLGVTASLGKSMGSLAMGDSDSSRDRGPSEFTHSWGQSSVDGDSVPNSVRVPRYLKNRSYGNGRFGNMGGSLHYDVPGSRPSLLPLLTSDMANLPRAVVLQKGPKGFGFILRGAKGTNALDFEPTPEIPALQYFEKVDPDTPAAKAGLIDGDYILEINGENVIHTSHERAVQLIRKAGDTLALKVITVDKMKLQQQQNMAIENLDQTIAHFDAASLSSLRLHGEGSMKIASIQSRASRNITNSDLQEMFARAGRPELPGETGNVKPDIVAAPKIYSDEADIKTRLRANIAMGGHNSTAHTSEQSGGSDSSSIHSASGNPVPSSSTFRPAPVTPPITAIAAVARLESQSPRSNRQEWENHVSSTNNTPTTTVDGRPPNPVYETAAEFLNENKNGTVLITSANNNSTALEQLPSDNRNNVTVVSNSTVSTSEPVPDYSDSEPETESEKASPKRNAAPAPPVNMAEGGTFQAMLAAAVAKREEKKTTAPPSAGIVPVSAVPVPKKQPPPPPPPLAPSSAASIVPATPPPPPPPPPPPAHASLAPSTPPQIIAAGARPTPSSVTMRAPVESRPTVSSRADHEEILKAAIAQRRTMIDSGANPAAKIESKLRNSRQAPKSMVFGSTVTSAGDGSRPQVNGKPMASESPSVAPKPASTFNASPNSPSAKSTSTYNATFNSPAAKSTSTFNAAPKPPAAKSTPIFDSTDNSPAAKSTSTFHAAPNPPASKPTPTLNSVPKSVASDGSAPNPTVKSSVINSHGPPSSPTSVVYSAPATAQPALRTTPGISSERPVSFLAQAEQLRRQMLEQKHRQSAKTQPKTAPPPPQNLNSNNNHLDSFVPPPPDTFADLSAAGRSNSLFFGAAPNTKLKQGEKGETSML